MVMGTLPFLLSLVVVPLHASFPDWLVTNITKPTQLVTLPDSTLRLTNGLIHRDFTTSPDFATVDLYSYAKESSLLRAINPEAVITLDGNSYNVGGLLVDFPRGYLNRTALALTKAADPKAFHYVSHTTAKPASKYPYVPKRGAPKNIVWPPKGLRLDVVFSAPPSAAAYKNVKVTMHYEMYDGLPLMAKWLSVEALTEEAKKVKISTALVEYLAVNHQWANQGTTTTIGELGGHWPAQTLGWLYVETDQPHGTIANWRIDPHASDMKGSFEPVVNCSYETPPQVPISEGFESFHVHELLIGSADPERIALSKHRMMRLLAPQMQENPIYFHLPNSTSEVMRGVVDQMAEVGFEIFVYSFGSQMDIESTNESYIEQIAADVAYARSKNIEVGAYDLISLSRKVRKDWMAVGGHGACFASGWYDYLLDRVLTFFAKTGMSVLATDGPYGGYTCASTNHSHHRGKEDSVYWQTQLQGEFFSILQSRGVYITQPDKYFYQGGNKATMGYVEYQYSLPRWQDLSISRQTVYDGTYHLIPTAGWMFVPLTVYHSGGSAAAFEPLHEHLAEYSWALLQYLGSGVAATYRGHYLYDSEDTKQMVKSHVSWYKKYRDILTSDIVHVRRPDMQWIDCMLHVNPFLPIKGLAMVFNPTDERIKTNLALPLYYTGLKETAWIREQEGTSSAYKLDSELTVAVPVDIAARSITWLVIEGH